MGPFGETKSSTITSQSLSIVPAANEGMTMSFGAAKLKRESSVSPPGWEHSSEEDQPLDFSRTNSSDESPLKKQKLSSPVPVSKPMPTYLNAQSLSISPPRSPNNPSSEHSDSETTEVRGERLKMPQPLNFLSSPPNVSPLSPPSQGLTPDILNSNFSALYGFAAYNTLQSQSSEALQANPGLLDPNYLHFRQQQVLLQRMQQSVASTRKRPALATTPSSAPSTTPPLFKSSEPSSELSDHSNDSQINSTSSTKGGSSNSSRRRGKAFPDELKDEAYWERRRKNNEAAKRSRDARRAKEDETAIRAAYLEQENLKLRVRNAALENELQKMRCILYSQ